MSTYISPADISPGTLAKSANINELDAAVEVAFDLLPDEARLTIGTVNYCVDTGVANFYKVSLPDAPTAYTDGLLVVFKALEANTGVSTIDVNSLGAITIKLPNSSDLGPGDICAGSPVEVRYSSTTGFFHINTSFSAYIAGAAAVLGSGCWVSIDDAASGFLNGKLVAGEAIDFTETNGGGDEALVISSEDASATNKGVAKFDSSEFVATSGSISMSVEYLKSHFLL